MVVDERFQFVRQELHRDGQVEVAVGCSSCHGWDQGVSPPPDLHGCMADTRGVGAHRAMRQAATVVHRVGCVNCHVVPVALHSSGHLDGKVEVVFQGLATAHGATPTWDGQTCSGVYCHGATLKGGDHKNPTWTDTSGSAARCGACHALEAPDGSTDVDCSECHPTSVDRQRKILALGTHLNGRVDVVPALNRSRP